jgi:hypothetical protein
MRNKVNSLGKELRRLGICNPRLDLEAVFFFCVPRDYSSSSNKVVEAIVVHGTKMVHEPQSHMDGW